MGPPRAVDPGKNSQVSHPVTGPATSNRGMLTSSSPTSDMGVSSTLSREVWAWENRHPASCPTFSWKAWSKMLLRLFPTGNQSSSGFANPMTKDQVR